MKHILVSGRVQRVGFRQYVKFNASKLNLKGWVKNLSDGRVEIIVSGNVKNVEKLIEIIKKGPLLSQVEGVKIEEVENLDFEDFQIIKE